MINKSTEQTSRDNFLTQLLDRVEEIETLWHQLTEQNWSQDLFKELHRLIMELVGRSSRHGLLEINRALYGLEQQLALLESADSPPSDLVLEQCGQLISAIHHQIGKSGTLPGIAHTPDKTVLLLLARKDIAPGLAARLQLNQCRILSFDDAASLESCIPAEGPDAIVVDGRFLPELGTLKQTLAKLELKSGKQPPVICIHNDRKIEQRLEAMRKGITNYYLTPVNIKEICSKIIDLMAPAPGAERVLIVDDDRAQADFAARLLKKSGMQTLVVTHSLRVLDALTQFNPDLVIMDLHMPEANGIELTTIIREQEAFSTIPILFLSGDRDAESEMEAIRAGGDDYLRKPIEPNFLVTSVADRIKRARRQARRIDQEQNTSTNEPSDDRRDNTSAVESSSHGSLKSAIESDQLQLLYLPLQHKQGGSEHYATTLRLIGTGSPSLSEQKIFELAKSEKIDIMLDLWLIEHGLETLAEKQSQGEEISLFLPQSCSLIANGDLLEKIRNALRKHQISGRGLVLEYRVAPLSKALKKARDYFQQLAEMGIEFSLAQIDDSTTAYKIINYLRPSNIRLAGPALMADKASIDSMQRLSEELGYSITLPSAPGHPISSALLELADLIPENLQVNDNQSPEHAD